MDDGKPLLQPQPVATARRNFVLAACLMAIFMAAVESTIIATAVPTIVSELGGFNLFSWVFSIYLLTQAVSIPIYGRLADIYGRRSVFFAGAGLFLIGSTLCGFAWGIVPLICFRALQGIGAGAIQPTASTILGDIYTPTERARIQGLSASVFGISAVVGPLLGAFLIRHFSWHVVFWVNIPIGIAAISMIAVFLRETVQHRQHRIDWLGSLLLIVAAGAMMLALVQGSSLGHLTLAGMVMVGIAALVGLFLHERSVPEPMLPVELWRNRVIAVGSIGYGLAGAIVMSVTAFLPTYVQGAMGRSPTTAGVALGVMTITWAISSNIGGRLMIKTSYRLVAVLGSGSLLTGCLILVTLTPAHGPVWAGMGSVVIGNGIGFCSTVFIVSAQASVPWEQRGAATAAIMFMRFVGQSIGAAGCGSVLNATMIAIDPTATDAVDRLLNTAARATMSPEELARLIDIVARSLHNVYLLATVFAVATLLVSSRLPPRLSPRQQVKLS
jgi:EmrB/QacA subfamily drug resistance transporter